MREIKFRCWDSYQKIMYQWHEIGELDQAMNLSIWNSLNGLVPQITMMQYTGLKDRNGKEIYEGDIVLTGYGKNQEFERHHGVVEFIGGQWQMGMYEAIYGKSYLEVIGNIYEHPELLKEPK